MNKNNTVIQISIGSNHIVYYDRTKGMYIVSLIDAEGNAENEITFDAYEEKEISNRTELIGYLMMKNIALTEWNTFLIFITMS